jgi:uncharacterized membrane protein HdeD (DUF308 family)
MKLEAENSNEPQKQPLIIADVIGWILFSAGIFNFISYFIWACSQDTTDKWFTRQALSLMCFGFAGIIFRLRKK